MLPVYIQNFFKKSYGGSQRINRRKTYIYSPFLFNFCGKKTTLIGDRSCLVKKNTIFYKQYVFLCICALEI